ncbi:phage holin family protein [uncultured Clostridium sp.]
MFLLGFNINGAIQGILVTGVTVYTNQLFKQYNKKE